MGVAAAVFASEDERQQRDGADERHGDVPGDDLAAQQVHAADEQRERADFAEAAGHGAEEHGLISEVLRQRLAGLHVAERGGHGGRVRADDGRQAAGHDPGGHEQRVGGEQERTAGERRVEEVLADAAVELLDDHDGEERADDRQPPLAVGRQGVREQDARDHGGQVADGVGLFHELAVSPLKEHARHDGHGQRDERLRAELPHADAQRREQGDDHVEHDLARAALGANLRLIGSVKGIFFRCHFVSASFAAASARAFSSAARAAKRSFAVLKVWVRGRRPGQLYEQLPHSKQSRM